MEKEMVYEKNYNENELNKNHKFLIITIEINQQLKFK